MFHALSLAYGRYMPLAIVSILKQHSNSTKQQNAVSPTDVTRPISKNLPGASTANFQQPRAVVMHCVDGHAALRGLCRHPDLDATVKENV
jgi:hypothetical protein